MSNKTFLAISVILLFAVYVTYRMDIGEALCTLVLLSMVFILSVIGRHIETISMRMQEKEKA